MAFNILFRGLICHLTNEKRVVFVDAHNHQLRLLVRKDDIEGDSGFPQDDLYKMKEHPEDYTNLLVGGHALTISGVASTALTWDGAFNTDVPSLRSGASCTQLRDEVKQKTIKTNIASGYLDIPGGELSVRTYFRRKAAFGSAEKRCIARTVRLALKSNGANVTITDGATQVTLKPDAEVRFINVDPNQTLMTSNSHFVHYYSAIYKGCATGKGPQEDTTMKCPLGTEEEFAGPGADCSNSHEP